MNLVGVFHPFIGSSSFTKWEKACEVFTFLCPEFCFWQVVDALELAQATMAKVYQNLSWAIAYNVVAIPIATGALLPGYDFAMTPSLSGLQNY